MASTPSGTIGARIRAIRKHFALKQEEFGRKIGMSGNRISEIENNKGGAGAGVLVAICREFPVSQEWMVSGTGPMLKPVSGGGAAAADRLQERLCELEHTVRLILLERSDEGSPILQVPLYADAVAAGMPVPATTDIEDSIEIPASWSHGKKNVYAVRVQGESMLDAGIMPGDQLLVEATQSARDQQIVIASVDGELTVKKLCIDRDGTIWLEPKNSAYEPILISTEMDFRIIGIVLAAIRHY